MEGCQCEMCISYKLSIMWYQPYNELLIMIAKGMLTEKCRLFWGEGVGRGREREDPKQTPCLVWGRTRGSISQP